MLNQVALVAQTDKIQFSDLTVAAAAIQKQVSRDLGPIWSIEASVNAFATLEDGGLEAPREPDGYPATCKVAVKSFGCVVLEQDGSGVAHRALFSTERSAKQRATIAR